MRREQAFDEASLVLVVVALVLMFAVVVAIAKQHSTLSQEEFFTSVEPAGQSFGFTSPLLAPAEPQVRVNELPQIR